MSYGSCVGALAELLAQVPLIATVERAEQLPVGSQGSVQPKQNDTDRPTPLLRLGKARRPVIQERGWTIDGTRQAHQLVDCELWAFADDAIGDADAFEQLLEQAKRAVRHSGALGGLADTDGSRVVQVKIVEHMPPAQPLSVASNRALFHAAFRIDFWEEIWA